MTEAERKVLDAAREWLVERSPKDSAEKALAAAVARAWPGEIGCKENCTCGESDECDECPTAAEAEATIRRWEGEVAGLRSLGLHPTR